MVEKIDFKRTQQNWGNWCNEFTHYGPFAENPLLTELERFEQFLSTYNVARTIAAGKADAFRKWLRRQRFAVVLCDPSGEEFDKILNRAAQFGANGIPISALSKVVSFLAPDKFIAYDRFARQGLNTHLNRARYSTFANYADYKSQIDQLMAPGHTIGTQIRDLCYQNQTYRGLGCGFYPRVLDNYLMRKGGRWP